jgi:nucleotide-binding universal stress UspA family protein
MKISNVLVPVDFSPPSRLAVDYGVALARSFRATLTLLHVVEYPSIAVDPAQCDADALKLSELLGAEDKGDLNVQTVVKVGDVDEQIRSTLREVNADFIVLGTHGRSLLGRALVGSVTQKMLRKLHVPVLTVSHVTGPLKFGTILFAVDLSAAAEEAYGFALEVAAQTKSDLTVLHVLDYPGLNYGVLEGDTSIRGRLADIAQSRLDEMAEQAKKRGINVETLLARGKAAEEILRTAETNDANLILLAIEQKGLIEKTFLGATAERVVREAYVPVLSLPVAITGRAGTKDARLAS